MALLVRAPPLLHLQPPPSTAQAFFVPQLAPTPRRRPLSARDRVCASNSDPPQQVNLSVLRFTLGTSSPAARPPSVAELVAINYSACAFSAISHAGRHHRRDPRAGRVVPPAVDRTRLRRPRPPQPPPLAVPNSRAARLLPPHLHPDNIRP